jgi:hypothetical protein
MGIKSTVGVVSYTPSHQAAAWQNGKNLTGLAAEVALICGECVRMLALLAADMQTGAFAAASSFTTSSTTITMAKAPPSWVAAGMTVFDNTNSQAIGTVQSVSSTTVTLTAAASHASSGSADSLLQISDPNIATIVAQIAALS